MAIFEGIFKPPIIGSKEAPVKIAGPGQCKATSSGLNIQGFKHKPKVNSVQLLALFFGLFFGIAIIKVVLLPAMPDQLAFTIPFFVGIYPFIQGQGTDYQEGEVLELLIPWENILYARVEKDSSIVIIRVKKIRHQGDRYQGALFFAPADGATALLAALENCGVKIKV